MCVWIGRLNTLACRPMGAYVHRIGGSRILGGGGAVWIRGGGGPGQMAQPSVDRNLKKNGLPV